LKTARTAVVDSRVSRRSRWRRCPRLPTKRVGHSAQISSTRAVFFGLAGDVLAAAFAISCR
jgi:hypothetical protein